jgi:RNA polymerase sigma-70 factor (ECF subfamily)
MPNAIVTALRSIVTMSDEEAMNRVKARDDAQAFARLVSRWEKPIQRLCLRMLRDEHRAEDMAQEVFSRLFARRRQYEVAGRFSTYLWRIALNICHDEIRRNLRRNEFPLEGGSEDFPALVDRDCTPEPGPDARLVERERAAAVGEALGRLSEPYRVVVVLRHYEGLKFREIADILALPVGTVKSRMAEALNQLGRLLQCDAGARGEENPKALLSL